MKNKLKKIILRVFLFGLLLNVLFVVYSYFEARSIKLHKMEFLHEDIPDSFNGKRIVFISDLHSNSYFSTKEINKLVERINERNPDIIIMGGDYTDNKDEFADAFYESIKNLRVKNGVFAVLGNHDHGWNASKSWDRLRKMGFNVCDNYSFWVKEGKDSIKIGGVGDFWKNTQIVENTIHDVAHDDFCIMISHNPDFYELMNSDKVDLMFSGHTHGGQISLFGLYAPVTPSSFHPEYFQTGQKYVRGWIKDKHTQLYVSTGAGVGTIPFRFFTRPEIVEITLKKK